MLNVTDVNVNTAYVQATIESQKALIEEQVEEITNLNAKVQKLEYLLHEKELDQELPEKWQAKGNLLDIKDEEIGTLTTKLNKLLEKYVYPGLECNTLEELKNKNNGWSGKALQYYIEAMTAAYLTETNISPSKAILNTCPTKDQKGILYWFSTKKEGVDGFKIYDDTEASLIKS